MMDQKKNDWLAALFFQPDKSVQELVNLGITPDNSNVKDREYYKGIQKYKRRLKTIEENLIIKNSIHIIKTF